MVPSELVGAGEYTRALRRGRHGRAVQRDGRAIGAGAAPTVVVTDVYAGDMANEASAEAGAAEQAAGRGPTGPAGVAFCRRCRIGAVDAQGLCVLCGAAQQPPTPGQRLAAAGGALLSLALSPAALAVLVVSIVVLAVATVTHYGSRAPAGVPRLPAVGPAALAGASQGDLGSLALGLLGPALVQTLVLLAIVVAVLVLRRRRARRAA
jgi:hypothetical protein